MGAGVRGPLVEAHASHPAGRGRHEARPDLDRGGVRGRRDRGHLEAEQGAGAARRVAAVPGRRLGVAAVVRRPRLQHDGAAAVDGAGVAPRRRPGGWVPCRPAVQGHLDPGDHPAPGVGGSPGDGHALAVGQRGPLGGERDRGGGSGGVRALRRGHETGHPRDRLRTHVGEKVHGRLLHAHVRRLHVAVVVRVQAPRPLDGARGEDQRPAGVAVHRQVVSGGARKDVGAEVL